MREDILSDSLGEVRGPVAIMTGPFSGMLTTSSRLNVIFGCLRIWSVISFANKSRSTARADPAGTECLSAARIIRREEVVSIPEKGPVIIASGPLALHEILEGSPEIKRLIAASAPLEEIEAKAIQQGMSTLVQDGVWKVFEGLTDLKEIQAAFSPPPSV